MSGYTKVVSLDDQRIPADRWLACVNVCAGVGTDELVGLLAASPEPVRVLMQRQFEHAKMQQIAEGAPETRSEFAKLRALLTAVRERCPGVYTTDQVVGETFAYQIDKLLEIPSCT